MAFPDKQAFLDLIHAARNSANAAAPPPAAAQTLVVPLCISLLDDQLTPVLAYRRLVAPDQREAPSFLLESVEGGERQGRHSILGAQPALEIVAHGYTVRTIDHRVRPGSNPLTSEAHEPDPLDVPRRLTRHLKLIHPAAARGASLPKCFLGGWVGFAGYDTVRYAEPELDPARAPRDDRHLPDLHFAYYDGVVVFDHVDKLVHIIKLVEAPPEATDAQLTAAHAAAVISLETRVTELQAHSKPLASGRMTAQPVPSPVPLPSGSAEGSASIAGTPAPLESNLTRASHAAMVAKALEYIRAGDIFQVVLGQRFQKRSTADPFDVYRALRAVNPSPYMVYMQAPGCILVASSPEILCRVRAQSIPTPATPSLRASAPPPSFSPSSSFSSSSSYSSSHSSSFSSPSGPPTRIVTNRPLAGTRRRGTTPAEDLALERDLLSDPKEIAEHVMLVDLGRNDVGKVAIPGTINIPARLVVERYSHVMHISSTVTGELQPNFDCWDALRAALPVGTISGAPKIRAMQIIDELEPIRRGPYGGGMGYVGLDGDMDIALALRTMVVPTAQHTTGPTPSWMYHIQAAGGIVADSQPEPEYMETVNKAAALARAIEVAELAFSPLGRDVAALSDREGSVSSPPFPTSPRPQ